MPARDGSAPKRAYRKAIGPRLQPLLWVVFGLFALLAINALYLGGVTLLEWWSGETFQNWFYLNMFLVHLVLGALIVVPVIVFGIAHMRNTYDRRNRRAVKVGYALFTTAVLLLASGIVLTRVEGLIVVNDETVRTVAYWLHVATPLIAAWLFVLHRLAGKRIRWQVGRRWAAIALVFGGVMILWQTQDPRRWNVEGPESGEQYFFPSLARTATGEFIPQEVLMNDTYCQECHADTHDSWAASMHRFSSFNNPVYLMSVRETREAVGIQEARFCAGCHDPVVFFSGRFDDPAFDDVMATDPAGQAGITCTSCHAITHLNSPRGNADYTIEEPVHYPFAGSENPALAWVNRQLVKAKPAFHKKTFLKPLHQTAEFCAGCHKVHLPEELNGYKWLRGQNHYDSFLLSGVSGHGVASFYYPEQAEPNCNGCHMPPEASEQFASFPVTGKDGTFARDHQFPSANTAIPALLDLPNRDAINEAHRDFNTGVMRVDIFGLRHDGATDGALIAPLRPQLPALEPGGEYLVETVVRTLGLGHHFTQGTTDSNQVWLDVRVIDEGARKEGLVIGRSGGLNDDGRVDPWSHFLNTFMLDRDGKRIDRRNAQDIFTPLYSHQIPPGAADSVHYGLAVPEDVRGPITIEARLQYRKFDTTIMAYVAREDPALGDVDLPILTLATDRITLPVAGRENVVAPQTSSIESVWQRWNDYGIGLLLKGGKTKGELRQAAEAFSEVEKLGRYDGPLNLARVYLAQGTVRDQAIAALSRAAAFENPSAPEWSLAWWSAQVDKQNGFLDPAIERLRQLANLDTEETRRRGFDFSRDYRLLIELGQTLVERALQERGESRQATRRAFLEEAIQWFERALMIDPENTAAHFNLDLAWKQLGDRERAAEHFAQYRRYKVDDNAKGRAISVARAADAAADYAANAIVIYDLDREGAFELGSTGTDRVAAPRELVVASAVDAQ